MKPKPYSIFCSSTVAIRALSSDPAGLRCDQTILLTGVRTAKGYPDPLRLIHYFDVKKDLRLTFLTNNFLLSALTIGQLYRARWQVELFFESSTWCTPSDAMEFQEPIALNRGLVGALDGSVRPVDVCSVQNPRCAHAGLRRRQRFQSNQQQDRGRRNTQNDGGFTDRDLGERQPFSLTVDRNRFRELVISPSPVSGTRLAPAW
jgi:hypothetical protein